MLLRDYVGPALRREGYKGPAGRFLMEADDYEVFFWFQKSKSSDRERVEYRINLRVAHHPNAELFQAANTAAVDLDREWQNPPAGDWVASFPGAMVPRSGRFLRPELFFAMQSCDPRDHWIKLGANDPVAAHAATLLEDIVNCVFPEIDAQRQAQLVDPQRPEDRVPRSKDAYYRDREREYEETIERLRAAGIPTQEREPEIPVRVVSIEL